MRTKCSSCLCKTCLKTCCTPQKCTGKKTYCEEYIGFRQLSIFESPPKQHTLHRRSWEYYGITKERYRQLTQYIRTGEYASIALQSAYTVNKNIAEHILLSVTHKKSYDSLRVKWELKELERIPYCRTDFYAYRRLFFSIFDKELRRIGK